MKLDATTSAVAVMAALVALTTVGSAPGAAAGVQLAREHTWCC